MNNTSALILAYAIPTIAIAIVAAAFAAGLAT